MHILRFCFHFKFVYIQSERTETGSLHEKTPSCQAAFDCLDIKYYKHNGMFSIKVNN